MAKHFKLEIGENRFTYAIDQEKVAAEATMDGIYVIETSLAKEAITADEVVRT